MSPPHDPQISDVPDGTRSFIDRSAVDSHLETKFERLASASSTDAGESTPTPLQLPLPEKYQLRRVLGRGGMGEVLHVFDVQLQRDVALKFMRRQMALSPVARQRFRAEAQILAQLDHHNVVRVYENGEIEGRPYFAMAYLSGATLTDRAEEFRTSARRAVAVIVEVAAGVQHAHDHGVCHRDLKGSNVVFDGGRPVVTDFGCAKWDDGELITQGYALFGTPGYMAPEVWEHGSRDYGPKADQWALGVMLFSLLAGEKPYGADHRTQEGRVELLTKDPPPIRDSVGVVPGVDDRLDAIVRKSLARNPDERYESVAAFATELDEWLASAPVLTPAPTSSQERTPFRRVAFLKWSAAALILLAGIVSVALTLWPKSTDADPGQVRKLIAPRLLASGDTVNFIDSDGALVDDVGALPGYFGTVTATNGQCEMGTAKTYFHELLNEQFPFSVRFEADIAVLPSNGQPLGGIYAGRQQHSYPDGKRVYSACVNCFGLGELDPNNQTRRLFNSVAAGPATFAPFDGTADADALTAFRPLLPGLVRTTPADPINRHAKPGPTHHLVIERRGGVYHCFRDGIRCGRIDARQQLLFEGGMRNVDNLILSTPTFADGFGLFVRNGGVRFQNVRLTRVDDPE